MANLPPPFLNRFEKYLISPSRLLDIKMQEFGVTTTRNLRRVKDKLQQLIHIIGVKNFIGFSESATIPTLLLDALYQNKDDGTQLTLLTSYITNKLLQITTSEAIYNSRQRLDKGVLESYLINQEHFNLSKWIFKLYTG